MEDLFLVFLGGSGSKVMEAVVHMAAMDAWEGRSIHALLVDVDGGNGNQDRAITTAKYYESIRVLNVEDKLFTSEIHLYKWFPVTSNLNLLTLANGRENSKSVQLSRFLFSSAEREMNVNDGFKGHPNIGVLFMQSIMQSRDKDAEDGLELFVRAASKAKRVFLAGSCYGGTGASCIPVIGRYLRQRLGDDVRMGLLAILPIFSLVKTSEAAIDPDSHEFRDRVKTVLSTYMDENILQYTPMSGGRKQLYDHIYLLGSPEPIAYRVYAPGKSNQENPATFFDWFACSAIGHFFPLAQADDTGVPQAGNQSVLTAWLGQGPWDWKQMDIQRFQGLQMKATKLMIAVAVYMSELHQQVSDLVNDNHGKQDNMLELYFQRIPAQGLTLIHNCFQPFAEYCALVVLWFFQIATHLPTTMFPDMHINREEEFMTSAEFKTRMDQMHADQEDQALMRSLYYQKFFSPVVLFRMECLRQKFWPRGNENNSMDVNNTNSLLEVFLRIYTDQRGMDEEKRLGVLLHSITRSVYYRNAAADAIMGRVYANEVYLGTADQAASTVLGRLFRAIDSMVRR